MRPVTTTSMETGIPCTIRSCLRVAGWKAARVMRKVLVILLGIILMGILFRGTDHGHPPNQDFLQPPQDCGTVQVASATSTVGLSRICQSNGVVVIPAPSAQSEGPPFPWKWLAFILVILSLAVVLRGAKSTMTATNTS